MVEPHYVSTSHYGYSSVDVEIFSTEAMIKKAEDYHTGLLGEFRGKNIKGKSIIKEGSIAHRIMEIANRENVDLIALASHGRSGLSRVYYGSVAASVLHLVDRPLFLVRADG